MINILNIYSSQGGQTQKIAMEIEKACITSGGNVTTLKTKEQTHEIDLLAYDMIFAGSGVYTWLPDKPMQKWMDMQLTAARENNLILPSAPRILGKYACVYCTYGGPHTGEAEAIPAVKYMGQLFDHMGFSVVTEWCIPGAFIPKKMHKMNREGRLGNIEGRPNADDLQKVYEQTIGLLESLAFSHN